MTLKAKLVKAGFSVAQNSWKDTVKKSHRIGKKLVTVGQTVQVESSGTGEADRRVSFSGESTVYDMRESTERTLYSSRYTLGR